ncbi:ATP-binding protein [Proteus mirabilis]|uniref:BbrUII/HgiDII family restriction enzyme n=1 Tax=Proteus mirabilis TaxID=584 RepID=UPI0018C7D5A5|nr:ATP-binding protein [Proteus mirabilis]MBG2941434.1 ATP-binding protein [Proteus mirabilis]MCU6314596.1 ATP-binding protein [Proteus mirabilis]HEK0402687.1 ATP-binding protein [Proteus mirabilis]HEK1812369.1 ATP-binding protein [Proteus mirabilis]HEK2079020.1 ATP-binding protein [Proteus mirabilis]
MSSNYEIAIDLNVLNHLGMSLYSNTPAVLTEIISNAWDADANHVDIHLNTEENFVKIVDDGHGMSKEDINQKFLKVGYARREHGRAESDTLSRQVMGRKGIGKLAMFSLANKIQIITKKENLQQESFEIDVEQLQNAIKKGQNYKANSIEDPLIIDKKGTIIILCELKKSIDRTESYLRKRLARRFSVIGESNGFQVKINNTPISTSDRDFLQDLQFIWEFGQSDPIRLANCKNIVKSKKLDNIINYNGEKFLISGYIGSVGKPSQLNKDPEISNNSITILSNGRVFEEDILLGFGSAKVFTSYLVGEIIADFLDKNEMPDMATSSRQKLQENDPRFIVLKNFLESQLRIIDKDWDKWRRDQGVKEIQTETPALTNWLDSLKSYEKKVAEKLLGKVNTYRFSGNEKEQKESKKTVLKNTILAFEKLRIKDNLAALDHIIDIQSDHFKDVFSSINDIEASMFYEITSQRLKIIEKFEKITNENELEKTVQTYLYNHLWLLDPSWERSTGETYIEQTLTSELKQIKPDQNSGARIDIAYKTLSGKHVIIEMKRPNVKPNIMDLVAQARKYVVATEQWYKNNPKSMINNNPPFIEVILLVGKNYYDEGQDFLSSLLKSINGTIMTYADLIAQSKQSYQEYKNKKKESIRIQKIIDDI